MIEINEELCIGCGKCAADCVAMCLAVTDGKAVYGGKCLHCGHCVAVCPVNAVAIPEYDMEDVQAVNPAGVRLEIDTLLETVKSRRSIRHYQEKKVEKAQLEQILEAGRYTATAVNRQACRFIFVQEELEAFKKIVWNDLEKAYDAGDETAVQMQMLVNLRRAKKIDYLFRNAPAVVLIAAENLWDAGLAAQNMELAALAQGLGMLYNGYLVRAVKLSDEAQQWLQTDGKPVVVAMLLGYPDVQYQRTAPRKKADAVWR